MGVICNGKKTKTSIPDNMTKKKLDTVKPAKPKKMKLSKITPVHPKKKNLSNVSKSIQMDVNSGSDRGGSRTKSNRLFISDRKRSIYKSSLKAKVLSKLAQVAKAQP